MLKAKRLKKSNPKKRYRGEGKGAAKEKDERRDGKKNHMPMLDLHYI